MAEPKQALIRVGILVEIPVMTSAEDDAQFLDEVHVDPDVSEALSTILSAAICYQESAAHRKDHTVKFSRLVLMHDNTAVANMGWTEVK